VGEQISMLPAIHAQLERQMVGIEAARSLEYEHAKRVLADYAVQLFRSRFFEVLG
jgi:hypothetical protein